MSRTWKDKRKYELGSAGAAWRKKRAELKKRMTAAKRNAARAGFSCVSCWTLEIMRPGLKCTDHGGGIKKLLLAEQKKAEKKSAANFGRTKSKK
jgi:hypothetical protein